jgi:membrane protease YdiL (CAAX protease family)
VRIFFYSFFKILLLGLICYLILALAAIPFILIPDIYYPNVLSSILLKQSTFLIAGLVIIIIAKYKSSYTNINFRLSKATIYYLSTFLVILIFCYILCLSGIAKINFYKITSLSSFGKFLVFCIIPTFFIGFGEEFIFRWFLINRLKTFLNTKAVIVLSAMIFCLGHNWILPNMLFAFTVGCILAIVYTTTDSVFNCISIHAAWNFGQRFFLSGMSEFQYNAQRVILLKIRDLDLYNWVEFFFGFLILTVFVTYYYLKDRNNLEYNKENIAPELTI